MSGWMRLWIVCSILLGMPILLITFESNRTLVAYVDYIKGDTPQTYWQRVKINPALKNCDWRRTKQTFSYGNSYRIECNNRNRFIEALMYGLSPAFFLALIGLTMRWIYRGFRPAQ